MKLTTLAVTALGAVFACGGGASPAAAPACDPSCQDAAALLALRDAIKLVYNVELQGHPIGDQDGGTMCPLGGSATVFGHATSDPTQGATRVDLTYVFAQCAYSNIDTDPTQVFAMTITGTITETGTIAVQPSSTTALTFKSDAMTLSGTVYSPSIRYDADHDGGSCSIMLGQSGKVVSGSMCGRSAGVAL